MLAIIEYIRKNGLNKAVSEFKLIVKEYDNKILLKYNQIESNMALEEVRDCRGLILEKDTLKVMSLAFRNLLVKNIVI